MNRVACRAAEQFCHGLRTLRKLCANISTFHASASAHFESWPNSARSRFPALDLFKLGFKSSFSRAVNSLQSCRAIFPMAPNLCSKTVFAEFSRANFPPSKSCGNREFDDLASSVLFSHHFPIWSHPILRNIYKRALHAFRFIQ